MAWSQPSVIGLVGQLQRAGLTYAQLAAWVAAVQAAHSGPVVFQLTHGHIRSVEVQEKKVRPPLRHD